MRILHLGKYYPPARGGIESHVQVLARGQAALGHDVTALVFNHRDPHGHDVLGKAVARTRTVDDSDGGVRVVRLGRVLQVSGTDFAPRLAEHVLRRRLDSYDVVHLHTPNPAMLGTCALGRVRKLVVTHHSDIVRQKNLARVHAPVEELVYRRASSIFATSPKYIDGSTVLRRHRERVEVLPLGIDLHPFLAPSVETEARCAQYASELPGPVWLFVGRLVYYKGLSVAIRALAELPGTLVVVGRGPLEAECKTLARELGVEPRIRWLRDVDDTELRALYRVARGLLFPSCARSEAFGLSQLEAMASGCPVINTDIPHSGVPWVSADGESGYTVPVDDAKAFAEAARRLLADDVRARLAEGARTRAHALFSADAMARRCLDLYGAHPPAAAEREPRPTTKPTWARSS